MSLPKVNLKVVVALCVLACCWAVNVIAQSNGNLPKDLLSSRSAVLIKSKIGFNSAAKREPGWQKFAEELQTALSRSRIDAVTFFHYDDVLSGFEPLLAIDQYLKTRLIKNIIIADGTAGDMTISIVPYGEKLTTALETPNPWTLKAPAVLELSNMLYRITSNSGLKKGNLLILSTPEFGPLDVRFRGRRSEFYTLDLKIDKLAFPLYPELDTTILKQTMSGYPFKYDFTDPTLSENQLRKNGYQFIFYYVHSTGHTVKDLLGYAINEGETDYATVYYEEGMSKVKTMSVDTYVYKFYIKHIISGNVFLGTKWDADTSWPQALQNYLDNMKAELKF